MAKLEKSYSSTSVSVFLDVDISKSTKRVTDKTKKRNFYVYVFYTKIAFIHFGFGLEGDKDLLKVEDQVMYSEKKALHGSWGAQEQ